MNGSGETTNLDIHGIGKKIMCDTDVEQLENPLIFLEKWEIRKNIWGFKLGDCIREREFEMLASGIYQALQKQG